MASVEHAQQVLQTSKAAVGSLWQSRYGQFNGVTMHRHNYHKDRAAVLSQALYARKALRYWREKQ
jgi:hypothetical protein